MIIHYCYFESRDDKCLKFQINKSYLFEISTLLFKLLSYIKHGVLKVQTLEEIRYVIQISCHLCVGLE